MPIHIIETIREIEAQCFPADMRISPSDLDFIVRHRCYSVYEHLGFITWLPITPQLPDTAKFRESDLLDLYDPESRNLFIFGIAVLPSFQRKSIAYELLQGLPPADCIYTEAVSASGVGFFERNGFERIGPTTDGQLMRKVAVSVMRSA